MIWLAQKTRLAKSAPEADMNESFVENKEKKKRNHVSCVENNSQIAGHPKSSSKRFRVGQRGKVRACFLSLCLSLFPMRIKCLTFLRFSFLFCLPLSLTEILLVYVFFFFSFSLYLPPLLLPPQGMGQIHPRFEILDIYPPTLNRFEREKDLHVITGGGRHDGWS